MKLNLLERVMELFVSFFIVFTGVHILPMIARHNVNYITFSYALSIIISSIYFSSKCFASRGKHE